MSNQAVVPQSGALGALSALLEKHKDQIAMALPRHLTPERMIRVALTAVSQTPALAECAPVTIAACIVQASILGLEPATVLGEAYLVPFWNGKTKRKECQLIPGYMGLLKLVRNTGELSVFDAQIVYSNDDFEFHKGSDIYWRHKWNRTGERGEKEGVWAGYVLKDGSKNFEYWTIEQIHRHRDQYSKSARDKDGHLTGAWRDSPDWLEKKTLIRQVVKLMPKSVELSTALRLDELNDVGIPQQFDVLPPGFMGDPEGNSTGEPVSDASASGPKRKSEAPPTPPAGEPGDPKKVKPSAEILTEIEGMLGTIGKGPWWTVMGECGIEMLSHIKTHAEAEVVLGLMKAQVRKS